MSILNFLFGKKNNNEVGSDYMDRTPSEIDMMKLKDVFIDNEPPVHCQKINEAKSEQNLLKSFLNTEYYKTGYADGYSFHSVDIRDSQIERLICEFLEVAERTIDQLNSEIVKFKVAVEGCSEDDLSEESKKLEIYIAKLEGDKAKLIAEKDLAPIEQGLISRPIADFKAGYLKGLKEYNEEKLFASKTGLFN